MRRLPFVFAASCAAVSLFAIAACSGGSGQGAAASPSPSAAPAHTALPADTKTPVDFTFTDVEVATGGSNALKLGFTIVNHTKDPQICDSSEFSVQLSDGTVVAADGSADDECDPDSVDPGASGTGVMYFDLPNPYTGPVTMFMVVGDDVIGQATTTLK